MTRFSSFRNAVTAPLCRHHKSMMGLSSALETSRAVTRPVEAATHVCLPNPVIGTRGHSDPYTKIDRPIGRDIQIDCRKELLLLVVKRGNIPHTSVVAIVFEAAGDVLIEPIAKLRAGSKTNTLRDVLPTK